MYALSKFNNLKLNDIAVFNLLYITIPNKHYSGKLQQTSFSVYELKAEFQTDEYRFRR